MSESAEEESKGRKGSIRDTVLHYTAVHSVLARKSRYKKATTTTVTRRDSADRETPKTEFIIHSLAVQGHP